MALNFNTQGNLHQTINLTNEEFKQHFGTNSQRMQLLNNALPFFKIFHSCGCTDVYVGGSYVSKKKNPEDIDICFDISDIKQEKIKTMFPQFFDINERGRIRRDLKCHIFVFDKNDTELFDLLKEDRDGNPKGLVKLDLNEILKND